MNDVTKHKQLGTPRRWGPPREFHSTKEVLRPRPVNLTMPNRRTDSNLKAGELQGAGAWQFEALARARPAL